MSKEAHEAAIVKVREDEKRKQRDALDKLGKEKADAEARLAESEARKVALDKQVSDLESKNLTESEQVTKKLEEQKQETERLKRQVESIADDAATRIAASELKSYRERALRENDVSLAGMVSGNTPEEIDASITSAKAKEAEISAKVEAKIRKELGANVPTPLAPGGGGGSSDNNVNNRIELASIRNPDEYRKARSELLRKAQGGR